LKVKNDPLLGLVFYIALVAVLLFLFSCATVHEPEKVLCLEPCQIGNAVYKEEVSGKDLYTLTINLHGFSPRERVIGIQAFDLRKERLTEELGYATCYTVSLKIGSVYRLEASSHQKPIGAMDMLVIKGVIACQD
jgi:hypothetical protein